MNDRIIEVMASERKVCPQLHLPLQSASNPILERMERGYTIEQYDALVEKLRAVVPGIELSTDVIVGFPGESESDFIATCEYLRRVGYDSAFLFAYSAREGTKAARWPETAPPEEKQRRLQEIIAVQEKISAERSRAWRGRIVEVLVDGPARRQRGWVAGKSAEFKTAVFPSLRHRSGDLVPVRVVDSTAHTLIGEAADLPRMEVMAGA